MKIGITGSDGFIGTHLRMELMSTDHEVILFPWRFTEDSDNLREFVSKCDVIVHLAGKNRGDDIVIYQTNVALATSLVSAMKETRSTPYLMFASSVHVMDDKKKTSSYARSKLTADHIFKEWSNESGAAYSCMHIPNVFGPFGKPYYNSVVATFCHRLSRDEMLEFTDGEIHLLYVGMLVAQIAGHILSGDEDRFSLVWMTEKVSIRKLVSTLLRLSGCYMRDGTIPELSTSFEVNLFNTLRSYMDIKPCLVQVHQDERGHLFELVRSSTMGQVFYSLSEPGVVRGNHYHKRKVERFFVLSGSAQIHLRRIDQDKVITLQVGSGREPAFVDIPVLYTHSLENIGVEPMTCVFWSNELYDPDNPDTEYLPVEKKKKMT